jgi:cellulose biosynthesis protein BcsQ
MSMQVVTVVSAKGGCGKTTVSCALALAAAKRGRRVLAVDLDTNFGLTQVLAVGTSGPTVEEVLNGTVALEDAVVRAPVKGMEGEVLVLPGSRNADRAQEEYLDGIESVLTMAQELSYDLVLLDTPGNRRLYGGPMGAADWIVIPTDLDYLSIACAATTVHEAREMGLGHRIFGMVITNARRPLAKRAQTLLDGLLTTGLGYPGVMWKNAGWEAMRSGTVFLPSAQVFAVAEELYDAVFGGWRCTSAALAAFAGISVERRMTEADATKRWTA